MISLKWRPTPRDLRLFAVLQVAFCALCVTVLIPGLSRRTIGGVLAISSATAVVGVLAPRRIAWIYRGWMLLVFPIGWCVSYCVLAATFYLILTPIGLIMRLCGHDPLRRRPDSSATFWEERPPAPEADHYFRQF